LDPLLSAEIEKAGRRDVIFRNDGKVGESGKPGLQLFKLDFLFFQYAEWQGPAIYCAGFGNVA
jgi:hypothetical protein